MTFNLPIRIIFDLDGTIIDSARSLSIAANTILSEMGRTLVGENTYKAFIGDGLKKQVERFLLWSGGIPHKGEEYYYRKFLDIYGRDPISNLVPFPGAIDTIKLLHNKGYKLGICTQKLRDPSEKILDHLKLLKYFDGAAFGDTLDVQKSDPAMVYHIVKNDQPGLSAVYVGDSEIDAKTAKNSKLPFILFLKGYRRSSIKEIGPDFCFSDYKDLPELLSKNWGRF